MVLNLATLVCANHFYSHTGWAFIAAALLIHETAIALGSLGLPDAVFYFLGRYPERAGATVRQTSLLLAVAGVPVIAIAMVVGATMAAHAPELHLGEALPWIALAIALELPTQPAINQLIAHGSVGVASALYVGFAALRFVGVLGPALAGWPMQAIPIAISLLATTRLVAHLVIVARVYPRGGRWLDRAQLAAIARFAVPSGFASTVGRLNTQIDKYVVELVLGTATFAVYTVAAFELPLLTMIPYAIGAIMQVRYVRLYASGDVVQLRALWYRNVEKIAALVVPLALFFIVMAPDVIRLVFADGYEAATAPFQVFTAILLHRVGAYGPILQAIGRNRMLIVTSALILVTNVALTVPFAHAFGVIGPALATALSFVPAWIVTLWCIGQAFGGGIAIALPWRRYAATLVVGGATAAVLWLARGGLHWHPGVNLALAFAGYGALYLVVARITGVVSGDDLAFLRVRRRARSGLAR